MSDKPRMTYDSQSRMWTCGYRFQEWCGRIVWSMCAYQACSPEAAYAGWKYGGYNEPIPYTVTDLGKAYRDAMQRGAKLNGGVKAGEGGDD